MLVAARAKRRRKIVETHRIAAHHHVAATHSDTHAIVRCVARQTQRAERQMLFSVETAAKTQRPTVMLASLADDEHVKLVHVHRVIPASSSRS